MIPSYMECQLGVLEQVETDPGQQHRTVTLTPVHLTAKLKGSVLNNYGLYIRF